MNNQQREPAYTVAKPTKHDFTHQLDCLADDGEVVEHAHRATAQRIMLIDRAQLRVHILLKDGHMRTGFDLLFCGPIRILE
jgi:hypothetical protein